MTTYAYPAQELLLSCARCGHSGVNHYERNRVGPEHRTMCRAKARRGKVWTRCRCEKWAPLPAEEVAQG